MRLVILFFVLSSWTWSVQAQQTTLDPLEFAVNVKGSSTLASKEVIQIFRNGRSLWPSGEKVIIVLPGNKSVHAEAVAKNLYGGSVSSMQKFWLALVFQGRANPPVFLQTAEEIISYVTNNPGAIGVLPKGKGNIPDDLKLTILK